MARPTTNSWARYSLIIKEAGQNRIRTLDSALEPQSLTESGTQGGTQNYSDPLLAKVVTAWPTLSQERKKIIVSLLDLP